MRKKVEHIRGKQEDNKGDQSEIEERQMKTHTHEGKRLRYEVKTEQR